MHTEREPAGEDCSGCPGCSTDEGEQESQDGTLLEGRRLVSASLVFFLAPVVLAVVGASIFSQGPNSQFLGALGGFGIGIAGSILISKLLRLDDEKVPGT